MVGEADFDPLGFFERQTAIKDIVDLQVLQEFFGQLQRNPLE